MNTQNLASLKPMRELKSNQAIKTLLGIFLLLMFAGVSSAQIGQLNLDEGVVSHKGIDSVYAKFSEAYETLKPETVANLYTEDAAYLSPNQPITNGRKAILENFASFFQNVKGRGQKMTISFQIMQRKVGQDMGYDVGIYTIYFYKNGRSVNSSKGKFVVVAVKDKDKKWRFQVDGYSGLEPQNNN